MVRDWPAVISTVDVRTTLSGVRADSKYAPVGRLSGLPLFTLTGGSLPLVNVTRASAGEKVILNSPGAGSRATSESASVRGVPATKCFLICRGLK